MNRRRRDIRNWFTVGGGRGGGGAVVPRSVVITCTQTGPTATSPLNLTVTFSDSVTGFEVTDITAAITGGTVTKSNFAGSGAVYTCDLAPSKTGTVTVDIGADVVTEGNTAATQFTISFIFFTVRDDFTDTVAAGSVNGTDADPGPGVRAVVDTESKLSLSSGVMNMAPKASPAAGDPRIHYTVGAAALARAAGLCLVGAARPAAANTGLRLVAWDTDTSGDGLHIMNLSTTGNFGNSQQSYNVSYAANEWAYGAIVLRSAGYHALAKGGGSTALADWSRLWVRVADTNTPLYPSAINQSATYTQEYVRVAQLGALWATAAVDGVITATNNVNDVFTHATAFLLYATVTLPASGSIEIRFRVQDASNYYRLTISDAGAWNVAEVAADSPTTKGSGTGVTNGMRVGLRQTPAFNLFVHLGEATGSSWGLDNSFAASTSGLIADLGTGGAITSLEIYPWALSGTALSEVSAVSTFLSEEELIYSSSIES